MQKEHQVYSLIKSMTATEKAYFKKFSFKRDNEHTEVFKFIFNVLDKQKSFSLTKLLADKKLPISYKKRIHVSLNTLSKRIVSALLEYRKGKNSLSILFDSFLEYELYKEKKLFDLAEKKIKKTEKFIIEKNLYFFMPSLIHWQFKDMRGNVSINKNNIIEKANDLKESIEQIQLLANFEIITLELESIIHKNKGIILKNAEDKKKINLLILKSQELLDKLGANIQLYGTISNNLFLMNVMIGKLENINKLTVEYLKYYNTNLLIGKSAATKYDNLILIKNLAVVHSHFNQQELFTTCLKTLEKEVDNIDENELKNRVNNNTIYLNTLNLAINARKVKDPKILQIALKCLHQEDKNKIYYFEFLMPIIILLVKEKLYKESLNLSSEMINGGFNNRSRDTYLSIRMLRAISWSKLENAQMFEHEITSIYKYLLKNKGFYFNIQIINFVKKITKTNNFKLKQKLLENIIQEFEEIQKNGTGTEKMKAIELKTILELGL